MTQIYKGHIATYNRDRGFGFVQCDAFRDPLWFHYTYLYRRDSSALYAELNEREDLHNIQVSFQVDRENPRGLQARKIRLLGPYPDLEDFLRSHRSAADGARQEFLDSISIPALAHIAKDGDLTQLVVSRIIRSAEIWEVLSSLSNQWNDAIEIVGKAPAWSPGDEDDLAEFSEHLASHLAFRASGRPQFVPSLYTVAQPLAPVESPLRCFREAEEQWLVIVQDPAVVPTIMKRDRSLVATDRSSVRMVIFLAERGSLIDDLKREYRLTTIRHRTMVETAMASEEERAMRLGRSLRNVLPLHRLQPYEVGSAYNESIFVGRAQRRRRILEDPYGNHAVYGGRKIGKTWFLKDVCNQCQKDLYSSTYVSFYVSLQSAETVEDAVALIQDALDYQLELAPAGDEEPLARLASTLLTAHRDSGKTVLLALDEIDDVLKSQDHYRLFARLRQLQQTYEHSFKFLFAGFKELMLSFSDLASNNPFANWIGRNHFPLRCLTEKDVQNLIIEPLRWVGLSFEPKEIVEAVFEFTSGHPYYVQSLCHSLVRARLERDAKVLTAQNVARVASEDFYHEVFDIFVANLSPLQMLIGKVFAHHEGAFSTESIIENLQDRFQISLSHKQVREEMRVLQACSVFNRSAEGYLPVMQRINQEFFTTQDDVTLALKYLEENSGV